MTTSELSRCLFCYKTIRRVDSYYGSTKVQENFFRLLKRYFHEENDSDNTLKLQTVLELSNGLFSTPCTQCSSVLKSFCDYYSEIEKLELQLKWKLWTLKNIINTNSNEETNCKYNYGDNKTLEDDDNDDRSNDLSQTVRTFRVELSKKFIQKVNSGFPKITLHRCTNTSTSYDEPEADQPEIDDNEGELEQMKPKDEIKEEEDKSDLQIIKTTTLSSENTSNLLSCPKQKLNTLQPRRRRPRNPPSKWVIDCLVPDCKKSFTTKENMSLHMKRCHSNQLHLLEETFSVSMSTKIRRRMRNRMMTHICRQCGKDFLTFSWLQRHQIQDHQGISCLVPECDLRFTCSRNLKYHVKRRHKDQQHLLLEIEKKGGAVKLSGTRKEVGEIEKMKESEIMKDEYDGNFDSVNKSEDEDSISVRRKTRKRRISKLQIARKVKRKRIPEDDQKVPRKKPRTKSVLATAKQPSLLKRKHFPFMKKEFKCSVPGCRFKFYNQEDLDNHLKLHGSFQCSRCSFSVSYTPHLLPHEMKHLEEDKTDKTDSNFKCPRENCPFVHTKYTSLVSHFLQTHFNLTRSSHTCPVCGKKFLYNSSFIYLHFKQSHADSNSDAVAGSANRCDVEGCTAHFLNVRQLKTHQLEMHSAVICCQDCGESFPTNLALQQHRVYMHSYGFKCLDAKCSKRFLHWRSVRTHVRLSHPHISLAPKPKFKKQSLKPEPNYACQVPDCSEQFYNEEDLQVHTSLHGIFPCSYCDDTLSYAPEFALHEMKHSDILAPEKRVFSHKIKGESYTCPRCNFQTPFELKYIRHHVVVHQKLKFVHRDLCSICHFAFNSKEGAPSQIRNVMEAHFKNHHDLKGMDPSEVHHCDRDGCEAYFRTKDQLGRHRSLVHYINHGKMKCPECGILVKEGKDNLNRHMKRMHPELFPILCPREGEGCAHRFETEELMQKHLKIWHDGRVSEEMCPQCGEKCRGKLALNAHLMSEHNVRIRSHICPHCGKGFYSTAKLDKHILGVHVGPEGWPFCCEVCGKKSLTKEKFEKHRRSHTDEKPYGCEYCENRYTNRHNLRLHIKNKHSVEQEKM